MNRTLRGLAGTALIVAGSFVAGPVAPAAAATSCVTVPVTTPGFTVGIGGTPQRIPSVSGISVCASTPDGSPVAPVISNAVGGACVSSCTTVSLQVSPLDLGPLSVTFVSDGVTNRHAVDPEAVGTSQGVCLVSIGTPQAPAPSCTLSLGSDQDLTATVAGVISQVTTLVNQTIAQVKPVVDDAVADAVTLADQTIAQATTLVNQKIADATLLVNQLAPQITAIADAAVADATALATQTIAQAKLLADDAIADATALVNQLGPQAKAIADAAVADAMERAAQALAQAEAIADEAIADATLLASQVATLVNQTVAQAKTTVDGAVARAAALVAELPGTVEAAVASAVATACNAVPDGPNAEDACTNPAGWAWGTANGAQDEIRAEIQAAIDNNLAPVCDVTAPDGTPFCGDTIQWAAAWVQFLTDPATFDEIRDFVRCTVNPDYYGCWQ